MLEIHELELEHYLGRAKNAIQTYLIGKLLIPKVYLDANLDGWRLDVLAIDRAGVGDVHGVRIVVWEPSQRDNRGYSAYLEKAVSAAISEFAEFPGHFRYLAVVSLQPNKRPWIPSKGIANQCLAADGVGRTGILYINVAEEDVEIEVLVKPERFRSSKEIVELTDQYVAEHTANWEVRE